MSQCASAARDEARIRQKGRQQTVGRRLRDWVHAAEPIKVEAQGPKLMGTDWRDECQSGLRRDGGV